jgi:ribonuclease HI
MTSTRLRAPSSTAAIDRALLTPTKDRRRNVLALLADYNVNRLAEQIRRRATRLGRQQHQINSQIILIRDGLIMDLYANLTPEGWATAWCDGSSSQTDNVRVAGTGVVVIDAKGKCVARTGRFIGHKTAFEAETSALVAALEIARRNNIKNMRIYTDSKALAQLWQKQREDPRLTQVRQGAKNLKQLEICAIPRLHNQTANALAKHAAAGGNT